MKFIRFTGKNIIVNLLLIFLYLIWNTYVGGIKSEHIALVIIWLSAYYISDKSRRFILGFSGFIVFWIIYDSMRLVPNYQVSTVHIQEPYNIEKALFGINYQGILQTPNEFFSLVNNKFLDFLSGFFYINWMPVPIGFGVYLYLVNKRLFIEYSVAFLLVNLLGFTIYYLYPAAPPWYVEIYGFDLHIGVQGNRAGLIRFDELIGLPIFEGIYNKNANVLAAMPSLHSAYPVIVLFYAIKKHLGLFIKTLFSIFIAGIWFSAVYSGHHYIIDVIAGATLALFTVFLVDYVIRNNTINNILLKLEKQI